MRRVRRLNPKATRTGQDELFATYRYHAVFTDSPLSMLQAEAAHRDHAIIEQVIADLKNGPLAHMPSAVFTANSAWTVLAAIAFNLTRAAGVLASRFHAKARMATIRAQLIAVPARIANRARTWLLHPGMGGFAAAIGGADAQTESLLLPAVVLLLVGVLFKVGAVPFHSWTPDVYQGAPTPVTGFMAACTKAAAFGAMLRIFYVALPGLADDWRPMLWIIAIVTMVVGTLTDVSQSDVKRMLAYSSVSHVGFALVGDVDGDLTARLRHASRVSADPDAAHALVRLTLRRR